uniref:Conserved hypothethical protein n=1 Tax=Ralstonia syzygii R24 TaxID=907261 RepID=G3ABA4_9RALS|nr:conserved hypothethical protein [Ralstonia syzygii R24]
MGGGTGRTGCTKAGDGDTACGCGAGWIVVRGSSHGGIGEEQAARPIAIAMASARTGPLAAPRRPCAAAPTKQTARFMHALPKRSLVESTRPACMTDHIMRHVTRHA